MGFLNIKVALLSEIPWMKFYGQGFMKSELCLKNIIVDLFNINCVYYSSQPVLKENKNLSPDNDDGDTHVLRNLVTKFLKSYKLIYSTRSHCSLTLAYNTQKSGIIMKMVRLYNNKLQNQIIFRYLKRKLNMVLK